MLKQINFFYSQTSTLPKDAPAKFHLSSAFDLTLPMQKREGVSQPPTLMFFVNTFR